MSSPTSPARINTQAEAEEEGARQVQAVRERLLSELTDLSLDEALACVQEERGRESRSLKPLTVSLTTLAAASSYAL